MKDTLGVSRSKGNQGTTRGKEKIILTSVGIEPTTSGLDLLLLCQLSYSKKGQIFLAQYPVRTAHFVQIVTAMRFARILPQHNRKVLRNKKQWKITLKDL